MNPPGSILLIPFMSILVRVGDPITTDSGSPGRRFVPIVGGEVSGSMIGEVIPGGGDWQTIASDGTLEISAHYILDVDGLGLVEVRSDGVRHAPADILEALGRGEHVDPDSYYFRTSIRLRGSSPSAARLSRLLFVARGRRAPERVDLDVFEVG